jgi:hypothetical protein
MGQAKNYLIECEDNGYFPKDSYVCAECVVDSFLASIVNENLCSDKCDYCQSESDIEIAADFDTVVEHINQSIRNYYSPAQDIALPYTEGQYILEDDNLDEVLYDFDPGWPSNFRDDICNSIIGDNWVSAPQGEWYKAPRDSSLSYDWKSFQNLVMYKNRYLFLSEPFDEDECETEDSIPLCFMLDEIGKIVDRLGLIKSISNEQDFYRVRKTSNGHIYNSFDEIGIPPAKNVGSGRMNPAGIPYLYLAFDSETAIAETINERENEFCLAHLKLKENTCVLDFSTSIQKPSIFDNDKYNRLCEYKFIKGFIDDITKPIEKDGKEHIDYVPTQIISEYFRYRFRGKKNSKIDGIIYPSSKNMHGRNLALFVSKNDDARKILSLQSVKHSSHLG